APAAEACRAFRTALSGGLVGDSLVALPHLLDPRQLCFGDGQLLARPLDRGLQTGNGTDQALSALVGGQSVAMRYRPACPAKPPDIGPQPIGQSEQILEGPPLFGTSPAIDARHLVDCRHQCTPVKAAASRMGGGQSFFLLAMVVLIGRATLP